MPFGMVPKSPYMYLFASVFGYALYGMRSRMHLLGASACVYTLFDAYYARRFLGIYFDGLSGSFDMAAALTAIWRGANYWH